MLTKAYLNEIFPNVHYDLVETLVDNGVRMEGGFFGDGGIDKREFGHNWCVKSLFWKTALARYMTRVQKQVARDEAGSYSVTKGKVSNFDIRNAIKDGDRAARTWNACSGCSIWETVSEVS